MCTHKFEAQPIVSLPPFTSEDSTEEDESNSIKMDHIWIWHWRKYLISIWFGKHWISQCGIHHRSWGENERHIGIADSHRRFLCEVQQPVIIDGVAGVRMKPAFIYFRVSFGSLPKVVRRHRQLRHEQSKDFERADRVTWKWIFKINKKENDKWLWRHCNRKTLNVLYEIKCTIKLLENLLV